MDFSLGKSIRKATLKITEVSLFGRLSPGPELWTRGSGERALGSGQRERLNPHAALTACPDNTAAVRWRECDLQEAPATVEVGQSSLDLHLGEVTFVVGFPQVFPCLP